MCRPALLANLTRVTGRTTAATGGDLRKPTHYCPTRSSGRTAAVQRPQSNRRSNARTQPFSNADAHGLATPIAFRGGDWLEAILKRRPRPWIRRPEADGRILAEARVYQGRFVMGSEEIGVMSLAQHLPASGALIDLVRPLRHPTCSNVTTQGIAFFTAFFAAAAFRGSTLPGARGDLGRGLPSRSSEAIAAWTGLGTRPPTSS